MKIVLILIMALTLKAHEPQEINIKNFTANLNELVFKKNEYLVREQMIKDLVSFTYGKGENIYVFVDPSCRYSKMLLLSNKLDNYRVNVILMNLGTYQNSKYLMSYILEKDTKNRMFEIAKLEDKDVPKIVSDKTQSQIQRMKELLDLVHLTGTPSITDYVGRKIELTYSGYQLSQAY